MAMRVRGATDGVGSAAMRSGSANCSAGSAITIGCAFVVAAGRNAGVPNVVGSAAPAAMNSAGAGGSPDSGVMGSSGVVRRATFSGAADAAGSRAGCPGCCGCARGAYVG